MEVSYQSLTLFGSPYLCVNVGDSGFNPSLKQSIHCLKAVTRLGVAFQHCYFLPV